MSFILLLGLFFLLPSAIAAAFNIGEVVFKIASYILGAIIFASFCLLLASVVLG